MIINMMYNSNNNFLRFLGTYCTKENLWAERYENKLKRHIDETDG